MLVGISAEQRVQVSSAAAAPPVTRGDKLCCTLTIFLLFLVYIVCTAQIAEHGATEVAMSTESGQDLGAKPDTANQQEIRQSVLTEGGDEVTDGVDEVADPTVEQTTLVQQMSSQPLELTARPGKKASNGETIGGNDPTIYPEIADQQETASSNSPVSTLNREKATHTVKITSVSGDDHTTNAEIVGQTVRSQTHTLMPTGEEYTSGSERDHMAKLTTAVQRKRSPTPLIVSDDEVTDEASVDGYVVIDSKTAHQQETAPSNSREKAIHTAERKFLDGDDHMSDPKTAVQKDTLSQTPTLMRKEGECVDASGKTAGDEHEHTVRHTTSSHLFAPPDEDREEDITTGGRIFGGAGCHPTANPQVITNGGHYIGKSVDNGGLWGLMIKPPKFRVVYPVYCNNTTTSHTCYKSYLLFLF